MGEPLVAEATIKNKGNSTVITIPIGVNPPGWNGDNPIMTIDPNGLHMTKCQGRDGNKYIYNNTEYTDEKYKMTASYNNNQVVVTLTPVAG